MQPTHRSSRILAPARSWFIFLSLFVALMLNYIPTGVASVVPDWLALVLVFWCIREPLQVNMGTAFVGGLLVDIGQGAAMGQHALAYVVLAYLAFVLSRRILWFGFWSQALNVLPLLLFAQLIMLFVRMLAGAAFPGWAYFLPSVVGMLLWVPLSYLLLWPQYRAEKRDDDRPI